MKKDTHVGSLWQRPAHGLGAALCLLASFQFQAAIARAESGAPYVRTSEDQRPRPIVAVDNACGWPNLTLLPDGTIIVVLFNQPSHAGIEGDLDCWASEDGGGTWQKRGTPAPHEPNTNRLNFAVGLAGNGDLITICSGWSHKYAPGKRPKNVPPSRILPPWLSRSSDGGHSWTIDKEGLPKTMPGGGVPNAFGNLRTGADGTLRVAMSNRKAGSPAYVYRSRDDGRTWGEPVPLNASGAPTETPLLHLGKGKWLAVGRTNGLQLFVSGDDGRSWTLRGPLTGPGKHPGHFLRLEDGTILLSYGNRNGDRKGVEVIRNRDEGKTWSEPLRVVDWYGDGGYPSSVQRADGQVVTAYYASRIDGHDRYHVGVVIWDPKTSLPE